MSYLLDVTRVRIKKTMLELGIDSEELRVQQFEDFYERGVSEDIQRLRFEFCMRRQKELVRLIKAEIKEEFMRMLAKKEVKESEKEYEEIQVDKEEHVEKNKRKIMLDRYFTNVQESLKEDNEIIEKLKKSEKLRESMIASVSRKLRKSQETKAKLLEKNGQKLKKISGKFLTLTRFATPNQPQMKSISRKAVNLSQISASKNDAGDEVEISTKIKSYEEKMDKSKALYDLCMQNRKNKIVKLLEKPLKSMRKFEIFNNTEATEKLTKIITKSQTAEKRRDMFLKELTEKRFQKQVVKEERRQKAQKKFCEKEKMLNARNKELEKKMKRSSELLAEKSEKWGKELELRNELQRLKDEEILLNAERKKRIL